MFSMLSILDWSTLFSPSFDPRPSLPFSFPTCRATIIMTSLHQEGRCSRSSSSSSSSLSFSSTSAAGSNTKKKSKKKKRVTVTSTANSNGTDISTTPNNNNNNNNNVRSGPRQQGEGCEEKEQAIVFAQRLDSTIPGSDTYPSSLHYNNNQHHHHQSLSPLTVAIRITLLAAGFIIGPSGTTIRQLCAITGCTISSATTPPDEICSRPTRTFTIIAFDDDDDDHNSSNSDNSSRSSDSTFCSTNNATDGTTMNNGTTTTTTTASHQSMYKALSIICGAVDRYKELCEGSYVGKFVERTQPVDGIDFLYQPPPHHIMPQAARIAVKEQQQNITTTSGDGNTHGSTLKPSTSEEEEVDDDDDDDAIDTSSEFQMCMLSPAEEKIETEAVLSNIFGPDHHTKYATLYQRQMEAINNNQPADVSNTIFTQQTRGYSKNTRQQQQHNSVSTTPNTKIANDDVGLDPVVAYNPSERHNHYHNQHDFSYTPPSSSSSAASLSSFYQRSNSYGSEYSLADSSPSLSRSASIHLHSAIGNTTEQQQQQQQQRQKSSHLSPFSKFVTANAKPFGSTTTPSVAAVVGMEKGQYAFQDDDDGIASQLQAVVNALHVQQQQQGNNTTSFSSPALPSPPPSASASDSPFLSTPGRNYGAHFHHLHHNNNSQQKFKESSNNISSPAYSFNYSFNSPKTPTPFSYSTPSPPPLPVPATAIHRGRYSYYSSPATPPPPPPPLPLTTASSSSSTTSYCANYQLFNPSPLRSLTPSSSSPSSSSPNMNMNSYNEVARRGSLSSGYQPSRSSQSTISASFANIHNDNNNNSYSGGYSNPFEMPLPIDVGLLDAINAALEAIGKVRQYHRAPAISNNSWNGNGYGGDLLTGVQDGLLSLLSQNLLNNEHFGF